MTQRTSKGQTDELETNDPSLTSTVVVVETIENIKESLTSIGRVGAENSKICIILGTICIVFIVAACYSPYVILSTLAEYSEDKILMEKPKNPDKSENSEKSTEPNFFDMKYNLSYMIVYEEKETYDWHFENKFGIYIKFPCKADEYEIYVQMSGNLFSGTDDKVEIRGYDQNGKTTEWYEVTNPFHNGIGRLSKDYYYCVNFGKQLDQGYLDKIGIRKFGSDHMIDQIFLRYSGNNMFFRVE